MKPEVYNQSTFLIIKTAYLYYLKGLAQSQIASKLNISVPTVSRLLKKAKEDKIIEFIIKDPYIKYIEMEEKIKNKFKLKDVIIASSPHIDLDSYKETKRIVGLEGARYIERMIREKDVLGITWGSTIANLIYFLNPFQKTNASFVTLHGSIANCSDELDVRPLVSRMAMAFGGKQYTLLTEGLMSSKDIVNSIKKEKYAREVFEMFEKVTIAVNGIGAFYPELKSILAISNYLTPLELKKLKNENVVGDICLRFFNLEGKECETKLRDRTIAINFDQFKKIKTKICVVAGSLKTHAVLAALKGDLINVLITDFSLADSILKAIDI